MCAPTSNKDSNDLPGGAADLSGGPGNIGFVSSSLDAMTSAVGGASDVMTTVPPSREQLAREQADR